MLSESQKGVFIAMDKRKNILIFFFVILLQKLLSVLYGTEQTGGVNLVLSGVSVYGDVRMTCSKLILWYMPISVLFFVCSGRAKELVEGYAVLQITRGEMRGKVAGNKLFISAIEVICLLLINILLMQSGEMEWKVFLTAFLLSALTILFFVFLEFFIELSLDSMVSVCIIQLLFVALVFMGDIVSGSAFENIWHYVLLSGFAFAERNGVYQGDALTAVYELGILFLGICVEIVLIIKKYKRQDLL